MKQNPYNLLSYQNIHKFGTSISHFVEKFTSSIGMKKGYISKYLPYSDSQILKYLNPDDDTKKLKVEDLIIILDNSDEKTITNILDSLCNLYGGSFNFHSTSCPVESFEKSIYAANF